VDDDEDAMWERKGVAQSRVPRWRIAGQGNSKKESAAMRKPTPISPASMIRCYEFAIGLFAHS
jgi:hypothetical protein